MIVVFNQTKNFYCHAKKASLLQLAAAIMLSAPFVLREESVEGLVNYQQSIDAFVFEWSTAANSSTEKLCISQLMQLWGMEKSIKNTERTSKAWTLT